MPKFYVTTPIYYVNDAPHIGHVYTSVAADVLARWHRLRGDDVMFLTGTDENSQKNLEAAEKKGYTEIQPYLDMMSGVWKETFADLGLTFNDFIRTTEPRHKVGVEKFWLAVEKKGDIYQGEYEGFYCTGCEAFVNRSDLVDGKCPIHKKEPKLIKEKNYFFRLKKYREALLKHIEEHPDFIQPVERRNEVVSYIDRFMEDVSISRETMKWGIPVPGDPKSVIYVWFDALINYLTGAGYGGDEEAFAKWWPADLHLVGKDIIKFHCALWPAMLMSAGLDLPKKVFAHGFFTIDGEKMSKSLGNVIDPREVARLYGFDAVRYFLLREITFGADGDFSRARLADRYANDLGNEFGNLVHRTLSMTEKYFAGKVPSPAGGCADAPVDQAKTWARYEAAVEKLDFGDALDAIWEDLRWDNKHIDEVKPWVLAKTDTKELSKVIYYLLEHLRQTAWLIKPFMPVTAEKLLTQLGVAGTEAKLTYEQAKVWGGMKEGATIAKGEPLFPRLEVPNNAK